VFETFDLTVQLGPGLVPWVSAVSRLGHVHGIPRRGPGMPSVDDLLDSVFDYVDAVRFAEREPDSDLSRALGRLVFEEPAVLELFQATRGVAADQGKEILVRILASPHLAVLPWELLPDPANLHEGPDRQFLTLAPDVNVVRLARGRTYPVRTAPVAPPLNLLVVLSSPIGRDPGDDSLAFDIYEEKRTLLAELEPLVQDGLLKVDVEDHPTLENLRRRIGAERRGYHLFHYLGHALPDRLILEDAEGRRDDHGGARFTEILRLCPDLRLAVFAGCETARAAGDPIAVDAAGAIGWKHMLSLADRCVQQSCPMVVGMQAVLPFRTERLFTRFFYQGLVSGYSVAGALRLARGATRSDRHVGGDLLDWSVPVLFVGGAEPAPLLERSARGVPPERPPRHTLRLGLRQRDTRFFARDVALRQAIDVLAGEAPERVLIVTGPSGVGKTFLIDRALEDVAGPLCQLYVRFEELVPSLRGDLARAGADEGTGPRTWSLAGLEAEAPLGRLYQLVTELLARAAGRGRQPEPDGSPSQRWPWLVEELTARRFVLAIDNLEVLGELRRALVRRLLPFWLAPRLDRILGAEGVVELVDLLDDLLETLRETGPVVGSPSNRPNILTSELDQLATLLDPNTGQPPRLGPAEAEVVASAVERLLEAVRTPRGGFDAAIAGLRESAQSVEEQARLLDDLRRLQDTRTVLTSALRALAQRRSVSRVALAALELPDTLLDLPSEQRFVMRLGHLTWAETWRWIRRNLPGLLGYGEDYLRRLWPRLGSELERWEELERRVLAAPPGVPRIAKIVDELAPRSAGRPSADRPRRDRPLRLAVAGPHLAGPAALAAAVTRLATDHGIGGRVIAEDVEGPGALAVLIDEPSPFGEEGQANPDAILGWIARVSSHMPDVVLLDYGALRRLPVPAPDEPERRLLRSLRHRALLIAAGGNRLNSEEREEVTMPAAYEEVLAIGPLDRTGRPQPYAEWTPRIRKPDLFMSDELLGTPLEEALKPEVQRLESPWGPGPRGSSFAALHAVAAAILVWATLPDLSPRGVRRLLGSAAEPITAHREPRPRRLDLAAALAEARRQVVQRTLAGGPCSLQALAAISGLDFGVVGATVADLEGQGRVRRLPRGRLERYELIQA